MEDHPFVNMIVEECRSQKANSPEEVARFAVAFTTASHANREAGMRRSLLKGASEDAVQLIRELAITIVPETKGKYRPRPVTFWNDNTGTWEPVNNTPNPLLIPRAIKSLIKSWQGCEMSADEFYQEFETIHPFTDGNGRVGNILWRLCREEETTWEEAWTEKRPPEYKKEDR